MKFNKGVSSARRKNRKSNFSAPSSVRRRLLSAPCSKEICDKYGTKNLSMPIRKEDEVKIVRGKSRDEVGKVIAVYRKRMCIHIERIVKEKATGAQIPIPIHPSNVVITKLKLDPDRKNLINRKKTRGGAGAANPVDID